jgi:hypothetical protein
MPIMGRNRENRTRQPALLAFCLALTLGLTLGLNEGCARSEPLQRRDAGSPATDSSATEQRLPFHADEDQASVSNGAPVAAAADPKLAVSLPFRAGSQPRTLPAGTLLTVQLEDSLSTAKMQAGDSFTASVAAPLTIDRDVVVDRGAAITGRVESAQSRAAGPGPDPDSSYADSGYAGSGYFRLTLSAITIEGRQLALQTSSLFARGTFQWPEGVRVKKGRRLTFRLTAPVTLDVSNSLANRQSSRPSSE